MAYLEINQSKCLVLSINLLGKIQHKEGAETLPMLEKIF